MSDESQTGATEPTSGAQDNATPNASVESASALEANVRHLTTQMQAMQSMHQAQMQQVQGLYNAMQQRQAHPLAPPQEVAQTQVNPALMRLDEDDPYFEQFQGIYQDANQQNEVLRNQVNHMQQSIQNLTMQQSRSTVQTSVEGAIEKHQVPAELANDFKTVAYAYMASAQPGQQVNAEHLVGQMMQNLGKYAEVARKKWAEEASKP